MKLNCPQCQREISPAGVNVAQGVCYCEPCNAVYNLSAFLSDESAMPLVQKPAASKVESFYDGNAAGYILPKGNRGLGFFMLFFALFWNGITWTIAIASFGDGETSTMLFMIPFVLIGLGTAAAALFFLFGQTSILLDTETVRVSRDLFGKSFTRKRSTRDMTKVYKGEIYRQNERPMYGVCIDFKDAGSLKFGSHLSDAERDWMISEIDRFRRENVHARN